MRTVHSVANSLLLLLGAAACDAKAGDGYEGEPLLTLRGSVSIDGSAPAGRLVPALAFFNRHTSLIDIVDVEVAGAFPAAFTLDVLIAPPASAQVRDQPGQHEPLTVDSPPFSVGYITAVAAEHRAQIAFAGDLLWAEGCQPKYPKGPVITEEEWAAARRFEIPATCYKYFRARSATGSPVYRSVQRCADGFTMCAHEMQGNPEFKADPYAYFAGFSENYVLLHLREPANSGSALAYALGAGEPLAPGYHLFSSRPYTWEEQQENLVCEGYAADEARQDFNAAHGTSYASSQELYDAVLYETPTPTEETSDPVASLDNDRSGSLPLTEVGRELRKSETRAKMRLGCALTRTRVERVESAKGADVSVRIGRPDPEQSPEL